MKATLRASSFMIKSTYLLLKRSSVSVKPWNFSGKGLKALVRCVYFSTRTVNSPV